MCIRDRGEVVADLHLDVADADDDARSERHEVDRVREVDPVLLPDLGAEQADHAVEHDRDAAEDATGDGAVSYTHLTLPTSDLVEISVVAVSLKKKEKQYTERADMLRESKRTQTRRI